MCVIVYKPKNCKYPSYSVLKSCFEANPHGAGFMYVDSDKKTVEIHKGFMTYELFENALTAMRKKYGDTNACVMHFRISTGGRINEECCHPYPISRCMQDLKELDSNCNIGVAHNGIISCCHASVDANDTMNFITDYLSLIVENDKNFYKNENKMLLIKKLCGSKLAILDNENHCTLIGEWTKIDNIYYSNTYWQFKKTTYATKQNNYLDNLIKYHHKYPHCPYGKNHSTSHCWYCSNYEKCWNFED